jgi:hypothetical protein
MTVRVAERLRILGQPARLQLVELLTRGPSTPQALSDIPELSQQSVSRACAAIWHVLTAAAGPTVLPR